MNKYCVVISVDNNRYGCYFKRYAKRKFEIEADNEKQAYLKAANQLKEEKRYKNADIRNYENIGSHSYSSFSINMESVKLQT